MKHRRLLLGAVVASTTLAAAASPGSAHPLGNFTVNVYSGVRILADRVEVDLVVDMAEIPAFQEQRQIDSDGDGNLSASETSGYATGACRDAVRRLDATADQRRLALRVDRSAVTFPPGMAGLVTVRLNCAMIADTSTTGEERTVRFRNRLHQDRVGWREITAVGEGVSLVSSDVPAQSRSAALTAYPDDLLQSPLDQRSATLRVRAGGSRAGAADAGAEPPERVSPLSNVTDGLTRSFLGLVGRGRLTPLLGLLALGLAAVLGAVHSLAPGHGKTVMAAYLVGQRGSLGDGALIALTVTTTHTAGVLVLGLALSLTTTLAPERLYPWFGLASGLVIVGIGLVLFRGARRRRPWSVASSAPTPELARVSVGSGWSEVAREHRHVGALSDHTHHGHAGHGDQREGGHDHRHVPSGGTSRRGLLAMGFAGGLVPSPSAMVVLLSAIALGRAWFGALLVLFYAIGMAAALVGAGLVLVRARAALERRMSPRCGRCVTWLAGVLPTLTALVVAAAGMFLSVRAAVQL